MENNRFIRTKAFYLRLTPKLVMRAHHAGWIKPLQKRPRFVIWSLADVEHVEERLASGEYPPPLPSEMECEKRRVERLEGKEGLAHA